MRILFLRVGIDRGCGGTLSPIFKSGEFEYVPIPENQNLVAPERGLKYSDIPARHGGTLAPYVSRDSYAHYDPEFTTLTYGEPSEPKRSQILRLTNGDRLVFYSGFQGDGVARGTCFVIGYFIIKAIHEVSEWTEWPPMALSHLWGNAHFRRLRERSSLVIAEGDQDRSRLLRKALPLSDEKQLVMPELAELLGFGGSVMRAIGRWIPPTHTEGVCEWLDLAA
jgi:hypothetical protein